MPVARLQGLKGNIDMFYTLLGRGACNGALSRHSYPDPATVTQSVSEASSQDGHADGLKDGGSVEGEDPQRGPAAPAAAGLPRCTNVMFISGMAARGSTEFFETLVQHLASLRLDGMSEPLLQVCTFDNRGIGESSAPEAGDAYSTPIMAHDTLALMDYLGWQQAHLIGCSLGGMIACKVAAVAPQRVASLALLCTTKAGWHMALSTLRMPITSIKAAMSPTKRSAVVANIKSNFSGGFLSERVAEASGRMRGDVLADNTHNAICLGLTDTHKFMAEGQYPHARNGHVMAVLTHRMKRRELQTVREAGIPVLFINGRHDRVARLNYVRRFARQMHAQLLVTDGAHAGVVIENMADIVPLLEAHLLGQQMTSPARCRRLGALAVQQALQLGKRTSAPPDLSAAEP